MTTTTAATKKLEILIYSTALCLVKEVTLKDYRSLIFHFGKGKIIGTENRSVLAKDLERQEMRV